MTKTLLEMSNLRQVARNERIQLAPMIEEIFTDLAPLSDKLGVTLDGGGRRHYDRQRRADLPADLQPDGECCQVQPAGRLGAGFCHSGVGKRPPPRLRHRLRHPGGVSAQYLPALLPGGQVSQPGIRRRRTGALTGMGDRRPPRRLRLGGEKFGEGHYHCGGAAGTVKLYLTQLSNAAGAAFVPLPPYLSVLNDFTFFSPKQYFSSAWCVRILLVSTSRQSRRCSGSLPFLAPRGGRIATNH